MCKCCKKFEKNGRQLKLEVSNLKKMLRTTHEEHELFKADIACNIQKAVDKIFAEKAKQCKAHVDKLCVLVEQLKKAHCNARRK